MKRRVIRPYKILAVAALGAGAGCTTPTRPDPPPPPAASVAAAVPTAPASSTGAPAPGTGAPPSDDKADPKLLALRNELDQATPAEVVTKQAHFRPLCDKDGYPLVGNLNRKSPPANAPSSFCASVRTKKPS